MTLRTILLVLLLLAGSCHSTGPASPPAATRPSRAEPDDAAAVFAAFAALEDAIAKGDRAGILEHSRVKTRHQRAAFKAKARGWAAIGRLAEALNAKFPRWDVNQSFLGVGLMFPTNWLDLDDDARVEFHGDKAMIRSGINGQAMIKDDGVWRVYFNWTDESADELLAIAEPLAIAMERVTPEIEAGTYRSARDAYDAMLAYAREAGFPK